MTDHAKLESDLQVFISYAHEDEELCEGIVRQIMTFEHLKIIKCFYDRNLLPGDVFNEELERRLQQADIVLLLVSPDFFRSEYCYLKEMGLALERHRRGEARVIPVLLRATAGFERSPLGRLQALPKGGKPVVEWTNRDKATASVAHSLLDVANTMNNSKTAHRGPKTLQRAKGHRVRYRVTIEGNVSGLTNARAVQLVKVLSKVIRDGSIRLEAVDAGSIVLELTGTKEGFDRLVSLYVSGKLPALDGHRVLALDRVSAPTEETFAAASGRILEAQALVAESTRVAGAAAETALATPGAGDEPPTEQGKSKAACVRDIVDMMEGFLDDSRLLRPGRPARTPPPKRMAPPNLPDLWLQGPDASVVVERQEGVIIEVNHRFADWVGIPREALAGRRLLDLLPAEEHKAARTLYEDAGAGGVHVIEVPSAVAGSRPRLVEFTSSASLDAEEAFAIIVGRDVGERAATERYLRAERDRLGLFIRAMHDALILLSPAGDVLFSNPAAERLFETYELPVICHRWLGEFSRHDRGDVPGLALADEGLTLELAGSDGRVFLVTRSFLFESGQKTMVMLMAKDLTDLRVIERQKHELETELIRESKLAEFGALAAGIAHNLNGPLTGVLGFCDLLDMRQPGQMEIGQIRGQALVMRDIVANLMQKSRWERENQPQELQLEEIIRTELRFLDGNLFFKHNVRKQIDLAADTPLIYGVYIDFAHVIGQLLRNAVDAMQHSERRELSVQTRASKTTVTIIVADTGCGIAEEALTRIFKPFYTTKPKLQDAAPGEPTGTGLGLSTSRSILARYGGEISVTSALGKGTTFTVKLPVKRARRKED